MVPGVLVCLRQDAYAAGTGTGKHRSGEQVMGFAHHYRGDGLPGFSNYPKRMIRGKGVVLRA